MTEALIGLGGQRVWSLLVSVFGDLAQHEGAGIDGPVLSAIMARMGVKSEATRVALHRLRKDGWIASEKVGRTSRHRLTVYGRSETIAASGRIYAETQYAPEEWEIVITDGDEDRASLRSKGFVPVLPRVYLGTPALHAPENALRLTGASTVPDWIKSQVAPDSLHQDYKKLRGILETTSRALPETQSLQPLDIAVLRCLIVHNWRRLVLKQPDLPNALFPDDWEEVRCRALVTTLLNRFPRPQLEKLLR